MSRACTAGITLNLHNTSDRVVGLLFLDVLRAYAVRQRPHHISRIIELSHCAITVYQNIIIMYHDANFTVTYVGDINYDKTVYS